MKRKQTEKWLSIILSMAMLSSLGGTPALAEEEMPDTEQEIIETVQEQKEISEVEADDDIPDENYELTLMDNEPAENLMDYLTYEENNDGIVITDCDTSIAGEVEIPSEIDGYPVVEIGAYAFSGCSSMTSVIVPDSVVTIGLCAFNGCGGLTEMTIPFVGKNASGTGKCYIGYLFMDSYSNYGDNRYLPQTLKKITVTDGAILGDYAFAGCEYLTTVILPDSLTKIGNHSFGVAYSGNGVCSSLKNITIPSRVTSIGNYAFKESGLTSIVIPDSVKKVGSYAFQNCRGLARATLSGEMTAVSSYTFSGCTSLVSISFPESVKTIYSYAFENCSALTRLNVPGTVTTIEDYAFKYCGGLVSITLNEGIKAINQYAFYNCSGITRVNLPNGLTSLQEHAFDGCSGIQNVTVPGSVGTISSYAFYGCSGMASLTLNEGIQVIDTDAFCGCSSLTALTIPEGVENINSFAFSSCSNLQSVSIPSTVNSISQGAFGFCRSLTTISISQGNSCYYVKNNCLIEAGTGIIIRGANSSNIPTDSNVTELGEYSFSGRSDIVSLAIPDNIEIIGAYAFSGCSSMTSVIVPDSVVTIGLCAFNGCNGLTQMTLPFVGKNASGTGKCYIGYLFMDSYSNYGDNRYLPQTLKKITVTDGAILGDYAFAGCEYLTTVILPDSLTKIGNHSFGVAYSGNGVCSSLKNITIPSRVTSIGAYAFKGSGLTSIVIPDSVKTVGSYAFQSCTGLTRATLSGGTTAISSYTFSGCTSLVSISFPESVKTIYEYAFENCSSLTRLNVPGTVTTIGDYAFRNCTGLSNVTINSGVSRINKYAFSGCSGLVKVMIPETVQDIGQNAFTKTSSLVIYGYSGSAAEEYANTNSINFVSQSVGQPTAAPTVVPTAAPTAAPTVVPTAAPTAAPTVVPTAAPTVVPTVVPTATPTAAPANGPKIKINSIKTMPGKEIQVTVDLSDNTGFASLGIEVGYNKDIMTLTRVTSNSGVSGTFTPAQNYGVNPFNMAWDSVSNITYNGDLATLTFTVGNDVPDGIYPITVDFYKGVNGNYIDGVNVNYDEDFEAVGFVYISGNVIVKSYIPGDINGDENVDNKDATFLLRYLAGWSLSNIVEEALDIDGSSIVDNKDATILLRYLAGWNVVLH